MLLYGIILILFVTSIVFMILSFINNLDGMGLVSLVLAVILFLVSIGFVGPVITNHINKEADTASMLETYESLYTQAYYHMYENDNDLGKKELANQITEWNNKLAKYKALKKSIWVSFCYPIDIDQFNRIPVGLLGESVG